MAYSKPYLSIEQQIELLRSRGMTIQDNAKATEYLLRIGYYRLSAYWHPLRKRDAVTGKVLDDFVDGATFKQVTDMYTFDGRLRLVTLDALERLEVSLRTQVSLILGSYDPLAHRRSKYLDGRFTQSNEGKPSKHHIWLRRLDQRALESKDNFAEHFRTKYRDDDMPIWIAVELLDFGPLSMLISGLRTVDRAKMSLEYSNLHERLIPSWVRTLSFARNVCAHHSRLWNKPLVNSPTLSNKFSPPEELDHVKQAPGQNKRYYALACTMQFMVNVVNPRTKWRERFINVIDRFPETEHFSLTSAGFPENWKQESLWRDN